jgi:hypothetical protein
LGVCDNVVTPDWAWVRRLRRVKAAEEELAGALKRLDQGLARMAFRQLHPDDDPPSAA